MGMRGRLFNRIMFRTYSGAWRSQLGPVRVRLGLFDEVRELVVLVIHLLVGEARSTFVGMPVEGVVKVTQEQYSRRDTLGVRLS